jgi:hypothetical protein
MGSLYGETFNQLEANTPINHLRQAKSGLARMRVHPQSRAKHILGMCGLRRQGREEIHRLFVGKTIQCKPDWRDAPAPFIGRVNVCDYRTAIGRASEQSEE